MLKKLATYTVAAAVCGGLSTAAFAQQQDAKQGESTQAKLFEQLDKNGDGAISADEVGEGQKKAFQRLLRVGDKDKNGTLTRAEFDDGLKPPAPVPGDFQNRDGARGRRQQFDARAFFKRFDKDGDGKLKLSDLPERARPRLKPLFDRLNKDEITLEDLQRSRRADSRGRRELEERFKQLDKDGDGKLTKKELPEQIQRRFRFVFQRLKKDEITLREFMQAVQRGSDPAAIFKRFDADKNGELTLEELPEPLRRRFKPLFDRLDKESVTREEFVKNQPRRQARPRNDARKKAKRPGNRSDKKRPDDKPKHKS